MWQVKVNAIKRLVTLNPSLQGCSYHPAHKLGNIGGVCCPTERHHRLCSRTIPTCGDTVLEKYNLYHLVILYSRRIHVWHYQSFEIQDTLVSKSMYHFTLRQLYARLFFYGINASFKVGGRCAAVVLVLYLDNKNRINLFVFVFAVVVPSVTFLFPFMSSAFQDRVFHLHLAFTNVLDLNFVLQ